MTQTIREKRALHECKVRVGERYYGPALNRPALRRMPTGWTLTDVTAPKWVWWRDSGVWVGAACVMAWVFCVAQTIGLIP